MASGLGAHLKGSPLALSTGTQDATRLCPRGHTDSGGDRLGGRRKPERKYFWVTNHKLEWSAHIRTLSDRKCDPGNLQRKKSL